MNKHDLYKKINTFFKLRDRTFIGVFIAESISTYWDYKTHPEIYEVTSAPWYTSIILFGIITLAIILMALIIKMIIMKKVRKMKRKITSVFIAAIVLFLAYEAWLYAYHNQKSNDNLPGLQSISEMEEADINEITCGYKRTQLNYMWDEPHKTEDDVDIWSLGDDRYLQVNYNNKDEAVITDIFVELFPDDIDKVKMTYTAGTAIESERILTRKNWLM